MISASDIEKLLESIPAWKNLTGLPGRVAALERRVAELEARDGELEEVNTPTGDVCPKCKRNTFELISSKPHPTFGALGSKERFYRCSHCSFEETKTVK